MLSNDCSGADYQAALEYGTKPPMEVVEAVRADAWLHAHGDPLSPEGQAITRQIRDAFYKDADIWHGMVLGHSLQACRQAVIGRRVALLRRQHDRKHRFVERLDQLRKPASLL